ncbi:MAG: sulfatase-like hydrolase/transferase [Planctomycetes bacterium]|nr:sulfatase-like hydrolase/transferase [Planctomycetota bacterium]
MRILYYDIDTLRPDHLGCYGYHRNTSPNIDRIAREGALFTNYYASDAPCLPSRAALFLGRPGIVSGIVGHGGSAADPYVVGQDRQFRLSPEWHSWPMAMRQCGFYPVSVSPYAERHSAWWFYFGWREMFNPGKAGAERADEVVPTALDWIERNGERDDWFLHVNVWDPHTSYRTPEDYGFPFRDEPIDGWISDELIAQHWQSFGPHSAQDLGGLGPACEAPRFPAQIKDMGDYRRWINGYDVAIQYADHWFGRILDALQAKGILDDTAIIISADHGENQGELNVYGDHQMADHVTSRVPLIIRWPGMEAGVGDGLHYNYDLPPTLMELLDGECPARWEGSSFAGALDGRGAGRDSLVLSQCAWSCQRSARFGPWIVMRTYHTGMKKLAPVMVFNVEEDPHELHDLADERPQIANEGLAILDRWHADMMNSSTSQVDPLWNVMKEGGPYHTRDAARRYAERLRATGRDEHARWIEERNGGYLPH